ncbi:MAG: preprotein translocase subunit SecG [Pseudomonadota bacterium]
MQLVFLTIQIILAIAIIGAVLLQRNGTDGLGSLSGSGSGMSGANIISGRSSASFLSKATTFLMILFMINSIVLGNLSAREGKKQSPLETIERQKEDNEKPIKEKQEAPQAPVSE